MAFFGKFKAALKGVAEVLGFGTPAEKQIVAEENPEEIAEIVIDEVAQQQVVVAKQDLSLLNLPSELRSHIFGFLLTNPELGKASSVSLATLHGKTASYDLETTVLRVCRKFYEEGMHILYSNTFYMACLPSSYPRAAKTQAITLCPLTRYQQYQPASGHQTILSSPAAVHVVRWNVVISRMYLNGITADNRQLAHASFLEFCKTLHLGHPQYIELAIIPRRMEGVRRYVDLGSILQPLKLVRSLRQPLLIRNAVLSDICDSFALNNGRPRRILSAFTDGSGARDMVRYPLLLSTQRTVEAAFKMMPLLLAYARSFELYPPFAAEMGYDAMQLPELRDIHYRYHKYRSNINGFGNPFRHRDVHRYHPTEAGLLCAKQTSNGEDINGFKDHRQWVVASLNQQYVRISAAASAIVDFIKAEKRSNGAFDSTVFARGIVYEYYNTVEFDRTFDIGLGLVQAYTNSFGRDVLANWSVRKQNYLRDLHETSDIRRNFVLLRSYFNVWNREGFVDQFKITVNTLEELYFKIQNARSALFDADILNDRRCNIATAIYNIDERIHWTVNEPEIGAKYGFNEGFAGIDVGDGSGEFFDDYQVINGCMEGILIEIEPEKLIIFEETPEAKEKEMWDPPSLDEPNMPRSLACFLDDDSEDSDLSEEREVDDLSIILEEEDFASIELKDDVGCSPGPVEDLMVF